VIFTAAYVAEIVRGGLQSVPTGQTEAGQAIGLSPVTITRRIVLPQALRNVIPALVGQFISLFKDTSLVFGHRTVRPARRPETRAQAQPDFVGQGCSPRLVFAAIHLLGVLVHDVAREPAARDGLGVGER
jgi:general L-amino acid transport system permease protein